MIDDMKRRKAVKRVSIFQQMHMFWTNAKVGIRDEGLNEGYYADVEKCVWISLALRSQ